MNRSELFNQIKIKKSFLCVGLDPDIEKMPKFLDGDVLEFNKAIIDATAKYAIAFKPNMAFYEVLGYNGYKVFEDTIKYIRKNYPNIFIIADAKRGDIGNTSRMYAKSFFEELNVDALTVAPYMGEDSISPFFEYEGKWAIILGLTSNKGSKDFQMLDDCNGTPLYIDVLNKTKTWGNKDNTMYVVGATQGKLFKSVRDAVPDNFLLVPGIGAQGGNLQEVAKYGLNKECGLIVNSSRGIIYASNDKDFAVVAGQKAASIKDEMSQILVDYGIIS
jgi:orotidine-5'-phosphate decarboxylase